MAYVKLTKVRVCTKLSNLLYAQCVRMGAQATKDLKRVVHQETLASVMTVVAGGGFGESDDESEDEMSSLEDTSVDEWDDDDDDEDDSIYIY